MLLEGLSSVCNWALDRLEAHSKTFVLALALAWKLIGLEQQFEKP